MPESHHVLLTDRDYAVFSVLLMSPFTAAQLLKLSRTFATPFTGERLLKRRLQRLGEAGFIQQHRYGTAQRGEPPAYYQLTRRGFSSVCGPDAVLPTRRFLQPVGWSAQKHTRCLADFIAHLHIAAAHRGIAVRDFRAENTVRLTVGPATLVPDATFELEFPSGRRLQYCVEMDCSTERIRSAFDSVDSIERKVRLYREVAQWTGQRFRVLFVTTGRIERLQHMVEAAAAFESDPHFARVYACRLADFTATDDALFVPCFASAYHARIGLLQSTARYETAFARGRGILKTSGHVVTP
jgi:hypothetical protein